MNTNESVASPAGVRMCRLKDGILDITIDGKTIKYRVVRLHQDPEVATLAYRLIRMKPDGGPFKDYDVAVTEYGPTCECPAFVFYAGPEGCKHIQAMRAVGLLRATR